MFCGNADAGKGLDLPLVTWWGGAGRRGFAPAGLPRCGTFLSGSDTGSRACGRVHWREVILQTFDPDNYVIRAASNHDYQGFLLRSWPIAGNWVTHFQELARLEYRHPSRYC